MLDLQMQCARRPVQTDVQPVLSIRNVDFWYGAKQALFDINLDIHPHEVVAFMGPSGCGKTTLLRLLNRMQESIRDTRMTGQILFRGTDIHDGYPDPTILRRNFGWVAQKPNPFPRSIRENVAYGPRLHAVVPFAELDRHVRSCLVRANLWDEVSGRLHEPGTSLSGGQQQRLCIARALAVNPDVLLMDEPCSAIDPIATAGIEKLILELKERHTVVIVTHNLEQARRIADRVAFFKMGYLLEAGPTGAVFETPRHPETRDYLAGKFG